ncbi:MAG: hypothetical protein ABSD28_08095 [Tepidisphaeraceae bacterium]
MSQYPYSPSPYLPPMIDPRAWAMSQPYAAGRAAGLWQLVLGAIIFLSGTCVGSLSRLLPDDVMLQAVRQQQTELPPIEGFTPIQEIRMLTMIGSAMMIGAGGLLLIFVIFVRRGGKLSTVCSIILNSLIALFLLMNSVTGLRQAAVNPVAILPLAVFAGLIALCVITLVKLVAAFQSAGPAQLQAMQQAYYWMMQQQQAAGGYGQQGYGYGQPPPPPPPQPVAPPPPPPGDKA